MYGVNSPAAQAFRLKLRDWLSGAVSPAWLQRLESPLSTNKEYALRREWGRQLWREGYAGLTWPREYGGQGLGPIEEFIFFDECARASAPETMDTLGKYLAGPAIINYGTEAQKERYLRPILAAEEIWCEGFSEPGAGSDLANVATRATRVEGGFKVNGRKIWTSYADLSDRCYLLTKTSSTLPRGNNLSVLLLNMRQPGVTVRPIKQITGGSTFSEVTFDDAFASEDDLLGVENDGWKLAGMRGPFRKVRFLRDGLRNYTDLVTMCAQYASCVQHCSGHRVQVHPDDLRDRLEVLRWHMLRLAELQANDMEWYPPASVLRITTSAAHQEITSAGLALECPIHGEYWRGRYLFSRQKSIAGGTDQIHRNVIVRSVLNLTSSSAARG